MRKMQMMSIILIVIMFVISGCDKESESIMGYEALDYVELYDYRNLSISKDFVDVTEEEVKMVIEADLDSRCIYKEVTDRNVVQEDDIILCDIITKNNEDNLKDYYLFMGSGFLPEEYDKKLINMKIGEELNISSGFSEIISVDIKGIYRFAQVEDEKLVLELYSSTTMDEVYDYVMEKTKKTIIVNYAVDKIMENSHIRNMPEQAKSFVENKLSEKENFKNDEAFEEYIGMTIQEYEEYNYSVYFEYLIYSAIAEKENILYSEEEINETIVLVANESNISKEDVLKIFDKEYIVFRTICDKVENKILSYVIILE